MEAVTTLRQLWRNRLLVAIGLALALVVGIVMAYRVSIGIPPQFESRRYHVGIASATMLVDSPNSQVVDLSSGQALADVTSLTGRARLLANLLAISPLKERIALRAGIDPRRLVATAPAGETPQANTVNDALDVPTDDPLATTFSVVTSEVLPIISVDAQAPTPEVAARISTAAIEELRVYLQTVASNGKVPEARKLVISPLGPARSAAATRGPSSILTLGAMFLVFGLWCLGIVVGSRIARDWREADVRERVGGGTKRRKSVVRKPFAGRTVVVNRPAATPSQPPQPPPPTSVPALPERPDRARGEAVRRTG